MALACAINHAHSAAADLFEDLVVAEPPVLVGQMQFGEKLGECLGIVYVGTVEAGFEQTTDAKSAGDVRRGIAMWAGTRIVDHARDRIRNSWGESFHQVAADWAARTPQR